MKHRGWIGLVVGFAVALGPVAPPPRVHSKISRTPLGERPRSAARREVQIWKIIIADSIAAYPHSCPCPYSPNRAGRACGDRSAYSRVAGSLICYPQDIPDGEIARYRERMQ